MKLTIEIEECKLRAVMRRGGFKTSEDAINFALAADDRNFRLSAILTSPFYTAEGDVVDPAYSIRRIRSSDKPRRIRPSADL